MQNTTGMKNEGGRRKASSSFILQPSTFEHSAFTLIEMLVVLGIVGLVAAITLPMIVPIMRTRTLDSAVDTVKTACILARSTAIQQRKMMNLTFLQYTDSSHGPGIVLTPYNFAGCVTANSDTLTDSNQYWQTNAFQHDQVLLFSPGNTVQVRKIQSNTYNTITIYEQSGQSYNSNDPNDPNEQDWSPQPNVNTPPAFPDMYVVMLSTGSAFLPYCIHYPGNYYNVNFAADDLRFNVLKTFSQYTGQTIQYLPAGCQFDFGAGYAGAAQWNSSWTYQPGNLVSDKGIVYQCITRNIGSEPSCSNQDYTHVPPTSTNSNWQIPDMTAWTYVFFPDGEVWTLSPPAQNARDTTWVPTTYMAGGGVSGPRILGPASPDLPAVQTSFGLLNCNTATIVVYGTTGQVISQ